MGHTSESEELDHILPSLSHCLTDARHLLVTNVSVIDDESDHDTDEDMPALIQHEVDDNLMSLISAFYLPNNILRRDWPWGYLPYN